MPLVWASDVEMHSRWLASATVVQVARATGRRFRPIQERRLSDWCRLA